MENKWKTPGRNSFTHKKKKKTIVHISGISFGKVCCEVTTRKTCACRLVNISEEGTSEGGKISQVQLPLEGLGNVSGRSKQDIIVKDDFLFVSWTCLPSTQKQSFASLDVFGGGTGDIWTFCSDVSKTGVRVERDVSKNIVLVDGDVPENAEIPQAAQVEWFLRQREWRSFCGYFLQNWKKNLTTAISLYPVMSCVQRC